MKSQLCFIIKISYTRMRKRIRKSYHILCTIIILYCWTWRYITLAKMTRKLLVFFTMIMVAYNKYYYYNYSRTIIGNGVFYLQMLLTVFFHSTPFYSSKHSWFVTLLLLALSILPCPLHNLLTALWCMCVISWLINRTRYHYR